jgi:probable rRNA maturation factor
MAARKARKVRTASLARAAGKARVKARAASKASACVALDIRIESNLWKQKRDIQEKARRAITKAANAAARPKCELAVLLTDDSSIRVINADWRGVDAPTNVLSFPAPQSEGEFLGDIVLAFETIAAEASAEGKPFAHHFAHLCVHGFLHLLGYDHVRKKDADVMVAAERDILRRLRIPDPYG